MTTPITMIGIAGPLDEPEGANEADELQGRLLGRPQGTERELKPLLEATHDAMLMLKDIKKARELPPFAQAQCVALGERLEKLLDDNGLDKKPELAAIQNYPWIETYSAPGEGCEQMPDGRYSDCGFHSEMLNEDLSSDGRWTDANGNFSLELLRARPIWIPFDPAWRA